MPPPLRRAGLVFPGTVLARAFSILFLFCSRAALAASPACNVADPGEPARVASVIDGDTVILSDSTRLRLIGIDTPELGRGGRPSESGALEARAFLVGLLEADKSVRLIADAEAQDRYGRQLAHLLLNDGAIVQVRLLEEGYATPFIVPPNVLLADCYRQSAATARESGRGLWALPANQPVAVADLDPDNRGFQVVRGALTRIGRGGNSLWLEITPRFAFRIAREDLGYFEDLDPDSLLGHIVQARGYIYTARGQLRMRIRHPLDLTVSSAALRSQ